MVVTESERRLSVKLWVVMSKIPEVQRKSIFVIYHYPFMYGVQERFVSGWHKSSGRQRLKKDVNFKKPAKFTLHSVLCMLFWISKSAMQTDTCITIIIIGFLFRKKTPYHFFEIYIIYLSFNCGSKFWTKESGIHMPIAVRFLFQTSI